MPMVLNCPQTMVNMNTFCVFSQINSNYLQEDFPESLRCMFLMKMLGDVLFFLVKDKTDAEEI